MYNEDPEFLNARVLREKAEAKLKEKQKENNSSAMEADVKKLLHELQVHQIELEMQNEELQNAYETTEEALKKYTMLYDLAPMGYFTIEIDGTITDLNFTAADILGERRFSLVNSNLRLFIAEESLPRFNKFLTKAFASHSKESCEVMLDDKTKPCLVYMEGIVTDDDPKCLLSVIDISSFKK